jgi:hypothetical protein
MANHSVDDLCQQMDSSTLICGITNSRELQEDLVTCRQLLRRLGTTEVSVSAVREFLDRRVLAYDYYCRHVSFSGPLAYLASAFEEIHRRRRHVEHTADLPDQLRLCYFIDREICLCAGIDEPLDVAEYM